jgi:hypothetical protein
LCAKFNVVIATPSARPQPTRVIQNRDAVATFVAGTASLFVAMAI